LRDGVPSAGGINTASPDTIKAMAPEMTFDYFAVRLNGEKAAGKKLSLNIEFTDLNQPYSLVVENGVLNYFKKPFAGADAKLTLTKTTLDRIQLKEITIEQAITSGELKVDGKREAFTEFLDARHIPVLVQHRDAMIRAARKGLSSRVALAGILLCELCEAERNHGWHCCWRSDSRYSSGLQPLRARVILTVCLAMALGHRTPNL
jgi:Alkyl sulfatase C-terminal